MEGSKIVEAALAIFRADYILVAAGAGFSADSGLPVYNDIARIPVYKEMGVTYQDLCTTGWVQAPHSIDDLEIFYGFWGDCFNMYRSTKPHKGYQLLLDWSSRHLPSSSHMFIYTSNVDGHFRRSGFRANQIYEIHGSLDIWQCSQPCNTSTHTAPNAFRFKVDKKTMRAADTKARISVAPIFQKNHPKCPDCSHPLRPNVMMFGDRFYTPNKLSESAYITWEEILEDAIENHRNLSGVVLELGCGVRVPSVRLECEMVIRDTLLRIRARRPSPTPSPSPGLAAGEGQIQLIRVNLDHAEEWETKTEHGEEQELDVGPRITGLNMGCLKALESIDGILKSLSRSLFLQCFHTGGRARGTGRKWTKKLLAYLGPREVGALRVTCRSLTRDLNFLV